jgi:hypothetical protein
MFLISLNYRARKRTRIFSCKVTTFSSHTQYLIVKKSRNTLKTQKNALASVFGLNDFSSQKRKRLKSLVLQPCLAGGKYQKYRRICTK